MGKVKQNIMNLYLKGSLSPRLYINYDAPIQKQGTGTINESLIIKNYVNQK